MSEQTKRVVVSLTFFFCFPLWLSPGVLALDKVIKTCKVSENGKEITTTFNVSILELPGVQGMSASNNAGINPDKLIYWKKPSLTAKCAYDHRNAPWCTEKHRSYSKVTKVEGNVTIIMNITDIPGITLLTLMLELTGAGNFYDINPVLCRLNLTSVEDRERPERDDKSKTVFPTIMSTQIVTRKSQPSDDVSTAVSPASGGKTTSKTSLPSFAIPLIIVVVLVAIVLAVLTLYYCCIRRRRRSLLEQEDRSQNLKSSSIELTPETTP